MKKETRRKIEGRLGANALRYFRSRFENMSPERAEEAGRKLGHRIYRVSKKHRERAMWNLKLAFPEKTDSERKAIAIGCFEHFGVFGSDFLRARLRSADDLQATMSFEGLEHMHAARELGKGVVLISGHFGNWERMSAWLGVQGFKLSVVARDTHNEDMNRVVTELRSLTGTEVIPRGNAARPMIEALRRNELVGILPDQNTDEIFIPFFGHACGTVLGPGVIAERTGAPVVPTWCIWEGPNRYRMIIEAPLVPEPVEGGVKGEGIMRAINASLERIIRQYPEQWLWFHDRWRSARQRGLIEAPPLEY